MGSYNSEYENYYNSLRKKSRATYLPSYNNSFTADKKENNLENYWTRRIIRDLVGVFILFVFVIVCKAVHNTKTMSVYNYSKEVLNENYDYKVFFSRTKKLDLRKLQDDIINSIGDVRSKVTGTDSIQSKIKKQFIMPIQGTETSTFGYREDPITKKNKFHSGIDLDAKLNTDVKACYDGKVKECGEDAENGKYILIDHGNGVETKYCHLNELLVKKEDVVKKSKVIAKTGNTGKSTGPHLHFELLYMGQNENPNEYFGKVGN
ncbi:M23 family metallopeptidase [Clostridium sp. P21]|uniref:M23 family metallopeptidase n=1 Tax=Clostridium muellerianum TaxID=2716538 RepID=A0A7Y0EK22_9CLOT|nr:M23 family metallopeptidase [Clostridium muellerianum]NMM64542.1 M23 family metallopeptidase [Clostridium muellerianum]